jgi:DNA invertase Pin-like site-specific DNA recombinase
MSVSPSRTAPKRWRRSGTRCWRPASTRPASYEDLASGRHDARPGLTACLKAIQPGNTLILWKLDRLGRDLRHLVNTVEDLRTRGVGLKVLTGAGAQIG